jgi:hypothetical protein
MNNSIFLDANAHFLNHSFLASEIFLSYLSDHGLPPLKKCIDTLPILTAFRMKSLFYLVLWFAYSMCVPPPSALPQKGSCAGNLVPSVAVLKWWNVYEAVTSR